MFGNNTKELEEKNKKLTKEISELKRKHYFDIEEIKRTHASEVRIKDNEFQMKINEAIEGTAQELRLVRQENAVLKKEVEILTKAFENMGFDVKDMKEILNKLVDGIVGKNQINVIKS